MEDLNAVEIGYNGVARHYKELMTAKREANEIFEHLNEFFVSGEELQENALELILQQVEL